MAEIDPLLLLFGFFLSGLGNAAGQWAFKEYFEHRAKKTVEKAKKIHAEVKDNYYWGWGGKP